MTQKGFSLIEVMIVIALIGILAAIAAPSFSSTLQEMAIARAADKIRSHINTSKAAALSTGTSLHLRVVDSSGKLCLLTMSAPAQPTSCECTSPSCKKKSELTSGLIEWDIDSFAGVSIDGVTGQSSSVSEVIILKKPSDPNSGLKLGVTVLSRLNACKLGTEGC